MNTTSTQLYLKKHKIGALFENLMERLVRDLPEEPTLYLINVLQKIYAWKRKLHEEKNSNGKTKPVSSGVGLEDQQYPVTMLSRSSLSDWAATSESSKNRKYEKPWAVNMKKQKAKIAIITDLEDSANSKTGKKQEWDSNTKVSNVDFDHLFQSAHVKSQEKTTLYSNTDKWKQTVGSHQDDEELMYNNNNFRKENNKRVDIDDDPLKEEKILLRPEQLKDNIPYKNASLLHDERPLTKSTKHKRELEAYLIEKLKVPKNDMGDVEDKQFDEANELLENADDLAREGVTNLNTIGYKISKEAKNQKTEDQIRVSICARCASIMENGQSSKPANLWKNSYDYLTDNDEALGELSSRETFAGADHGLTSDEESKSITEFQYSDNDREVKSSEQLSTKHSWYKPLESEDEESIDWDRDRMGKSTRFKT